MAKHETDIEGPGEENTLFKPGNATSLPTKHYAASTKMATEGKDTKIEGPCEDKKGYKK